MLGLLGRKEKRTQKIDEHALITEARYVVVDTELTGLDEKKDSIVSIGAVRMAGGRIDVGNTFYRLVCPESELCAKSVVIHEITPSDVVEMPSIDTVLREFTAFCADDILVGHFVSIDVEFINREMLRTRGTALANHVVDTFSIYEWLRKRSRSRAGEDSRQQSSFRLYDIVKEFGIPVNGAHNALMDAFITAQLFQRFIPLLARTEVREIGELLRIGSPFKGGDRFRLTGEFGNF
jgi:DNA polymerase-3 subunit epsilon